MNIAPKPEAKATSSAACSATPAETLSMLADGETVADAHATDQACSLWRQDPDARRKWHAYHLIGDVMRSEELAGRPEHDTAFMARLRERLAAEPVVLAPAASMAPAVPKRRQAWVLPVAAAAGFVAVAGVLVVARMGPSADGAGAPSLAAAPPSAKAPTVVVASPLANGQRIERDPRLEEFLRAHQAARGGLSAAAPGGAIRRVEVVVPGPVVPVPVSVSASGGER
jgi:sigma-E factor negative regulatory protein RseA